jgi:hypothetical protein
MFARKACYFFVRPKRSFLEVCIFLPRTVRAPQVKRATPSSKVKVAHLLHIRHRDEVEAPITDWLLEAYSLEDAVHPRPVAAAAPRRAVAKRAKSKPVKSKPVKSKRPAVKRPTTKRSRKSR